MDLQTIVPWVLTFAGLLIGGGGVAALVQARSLNTKTRAEARKLALEAERVREETASFVTKSDLDRALSLVDELQEDNTRLRTHLVESDDRAEATRQQIAAMECRFREQVKATEQRYREQQQAMEARYKAQMSEIEARHRLEIQALKAGVLVLIQQLREMGVTPRWEPAWAACANEP